LAFRLGRLAALEAQYLEQRLAVAQELAERLAGADP
jgi:hypothetical protein